LSTCTTFPVPMQSFFTSRSRGRDPDRATDQHDNGDPNDRSLPMHGRDTPPSVSESGSNSSLGNPPDSSCTSEDFHNAAPGMSQEVKCAMTANFIHSKQEEKLWTTGAEGEGVFLKRSRGSYITCPQTLLHDGSSTYEAVHRLNVKVRTSARDRHLAFR
jgi:hypothetical protein